MFVSLAYSFLPSSQGHLAVALFACGCALAAVLPGVRHYRCCPRPDLAGDVRLRCSTPRKIFSERVREFAAVVPAR